MDRLGFLKRLALPIAAAGAAKLDAENEEMDAQIIVNAPGVTISGARLVSNRPAKTAITIKDSDHARIMNNAIWNRT